MKFQKMMDVSTSHISKMDNYILLNDLCDDLVFYPKYGGFFVCVPEVKDFVEMDLSMMSNGFKIILKKAMKHHADWILLDSAGTIYSDLEVYEW